MFDKPDVITKASYQVSSSYGPDHDYYKCVDNNNSAVTTTYKIGNVEKVVKPDGSYDMKRYLAGVSLWNHHFNSVGTQTGIDKQYLYTDALGSLVLITDGIGTVQRQYAYDAWGRRVDSADWSTPLSTTPFLPVSQQPTTQGFTGQDMLDAVGLIHYGGRIYDQKLGRFVQADSGVPYPKNLQSHNRHSYVRNNPLGRVDPSGYSDLELGSPSSVTTVYAYADSSGTGTGTAPQFAITPLELKIPDFLPPITASGITNAALAAPPSPTPRTAPARPLTPRHTHRSAAVVVAAAVAQLAQVMAMAPRHQEVPRHLRPD